MYEEEAYLRGKSPISSPTMGVGVEVGVGAIARGGDSVG